MKQETIYICGAVRTAIGSYGGSLKTVPAHTLGALVIREALRRSGIQDELVDEVILGEVRQTTEASNIARCALLEAGLPEDVPGFTVNRLCASSMQAVYNGCMELWCGDADVIGAGGTENLSRAPIFLRLPERVFLRAKQHKGSVHHPALATLLFNHSSAGSSGL